MLNDQCTAIKDILDEHSTAQNTAFSTITNDQSKLSNVTNDIITSLEQLKKQMNLLESKINGNNENLNPRPGRNNNTYRDNGNYCWTHGYRIGNKHNSETCKNPAQGHKKATKANTMGGSKRGKP